ncbi:zinc-binding dehydrogenase [Nocardia sp. NPDC020380]|uniref:zinc-binding dehydrogenase n=1 Tax=Nocardia sp. NPDC020380 TaxID=3364309 RepID=UPI0037A9DE5A
MHAIRLHEFGPAENLRYDTVPDPEPGPGQVRIRVAAAGVHLIDTVQRQGRTEGPMVLPSLPSIPGREIAGTVDRVGPDTDESWLGRAVVAHIGMAPGGYAELTVTEAERLHPIPAGLDPAAAVAMIGTGRTTLGILAFTDITPDTVAVVTSAAGGIGTLLVQYLKFLGATVIGLSGSPEKAEQVARNGADLSLDYHASEWPDQIRATYGDRPATILFDGVGGKTARAAFDLLAPGGIRLIYGWSDSPIEITEAEHAERHVTSQVVLGPKMLELGGGLRTLETRALAEAATGRLRPAVHPFPLSEAAIAHHALESGATTGKVVLVP